MSLRVTSRRLRWKGCSGWTTYTSFVIKSWWKAAPRGRSRRSSGSPAGPSGNTSTEAVPIRKEAQPRRGRSGTPSGAGRDRARRLEPVDGRQAAADRDAAPPLLVAEGHRLGVTLVRAAVAEWKRQRREVFVPLTTGPAISPRSTSSRSSSTRRHAPEGVPLPHAPDVPRAATSPGSTRARIKSASSTGTCAPSRTSRACPRACATTICGRPSCAILVGGERALTAADAALASHYLPRAVLLSARRGHDKGGVEAAGGPSAAAASSRFRAARPRRNQCAPCSRSSMRACETRPECGRADDRRALRRGAAPLSSRPAPVCAGATPLATVSPRALVRLEGAVYSVPCRLGGARARRRASARHTVTIVGPDGAQRAAPRALWRAVDRLPALPARARPQAAGRAPGAAGSAPRSRRARFRPSGTGSTGRTGRATPPGASRTSSAQLVRRAPPRRPRLDRRASPRDAAPARPGPRRRARSASRRTPATSSPAIDVRDAGARPTTTPGSRGGVMSAVAAPI